MIIAIVTAIMYLFGGGSSLEHHLLDIEKPVEAAVTDEDTAEKVITLSEQLGKDLEELNEKITDLKPGFMDRHEDHAATRADIEAALDRLLAIREAAQKDILEARFAMKDLMTEAEWNQVFGETAE